MPDLYDAHWNNTRLVRAAFDAAARAAKDSIRRDDTVAREVLVRNAALLLGAFVESALLRFISDPRGLSDIQRSSVLAEATQEDRWKQVIKQAFAQRYGVRVANTPTQLDFTARARYDELVRIVDGYLVDLILVRNSLAHGGWHRAFTSDGTAISTDRTRAVNTLQLLDLMTLANVVDHLLLLLHDLLVTRNAFERDFDKHWGDLHAATLRLRKQDPVAWAAAIRQRRVRGSVYLEANLRARAAQQSPAAAQGTSSSTDSLT